MLVVPRAGRPFAKGPFFTFLITVAATEPWRSDTYFSGGLDLVVIAKAVLSLAGVVAAWLLTRGRRPRAVPAWPSIFVGLYLATTVFGGWASGELFASVVTAVRVVVLVTTVVLLLRGYDGYAVMAGLIGALTAVGAFSVLTSSGRLVDGRLAGGIPPLHPNEVAAICVLALLWLLSRAIDGRETLVDLVGILIAGLVLVVTGSRTSMGALVPAVLVLIMLTRRVHLRVLIPFLLALPVVAAVAAFTDVIFDVVTRAGTADNIYSLSNRTIAWQAALAPKGDDWLTWLGGGLALKEIEVPGQWWSHQILDSSWISAVVQGGYLGVLIVLVFYAYGAYRVFRDHGELRGFQVAVVVFLGVRGILESGLFDSSTAFLVLFTALSLPPEPSRWRRKWTSQPANELGILSSVGVLSGAQHQGKGMTQMRRRMLVAANLLALGVVVAGLFNFFAPRQYESSVTLYATAAGRQLRASDIYQGTMMVAARMNTYVTLAKSPVVLRGVIEELSLDESVTSLATRVDATNPDGTAVLTITATDADPAQAQLLAATVASKFSESVVGLEQNSGSSAQVAFSAVGPAEAPAAPSSPNRALNLAYGTLAGGVLALMVLLWPFVRIASSPNGQLRVILLGPLANRLDPSIVVGGGAPRQEQADGGAQDRPHATSVAGARHGE